MISPAPKASSTITEVTREEDALILKSKAGNCRVEVKTAGIIRVRYTKKPEFLAKKRTGVVYTDSTAAWDFQEDEKQIILKTKSIALFIDRLSASFTWQNREGKELLRERARQSRELEEFDAWKVVYDERARVEKIETPDGIKQIIRSADRVFDRKLYKTRLHLTFGENEAIYGFGQNDEGLLNLRGKRLYVHHANLKIAVPVLISSRGYGILFDTYSPLIFSDMGGDSYVRTEADDEMDYYFINGGNMDGVVKGYRLLSGKAAMLPKWAFGYIQSQERYESQEEILKVAAEFRRRGFGLDCIVLDWCSWKDGHWGQKSMDPVRFPDPGKMIQKLHSEHVRFMISIWPNMDEKTENYREMKSQGLLLDGTSLYNPYSREARRLYWKQAKEGLFDYGVDAWWCDSSEPLSPEWAHIEKPEPDAAYYEYLEEAGRQLDCADMHSYGLYHARTMYEGQREACRDKRVMNLTRSGYTGQQRYGTVLWSGDVSASWDTFRKQIADGLNLCASGLPYWTTDAGGFFVKKGMPWFWNGEYEEGNKNAGYRELYVRWFQFGCFCPVFRSHGTDTRREPWMFGEEGEPFYDALKKTCELRYRLLPYIYSCAFRVWKDDFSMMRMLAFDFPEDAEALDCADQYLFGDSLMVCPAVTPMYYDEQGNALAEEKVRGVYLPKHPGGWYDFQTGTRYEGGKRIRAEALLDRILVYVKAGTILPFAMPGESVDETDTRTLTLKVYPGRDAETLLYEDSGDGYGYEEGQYSVTKLSWCEKTGKVHVGKPEGSYEGMPQNRSFAVEIVKRADGQQ